MSLESIVTYCREKRPALIYLAVGCAQVHHTRENAAPQEYPPFVAEWPGTKVCILIDPMLESPPYCFRDIGMSQEQEDAVKDSIMVTHGDTTFFCIRRSCIIPVINDPTEGGIGTDMSFIYALCDVACTLPSTKFIFQNYAGHEITRLYPTNLFGESLIKNVLFDVCYGAGSCYIDFSAVKILRDSNGDFVHTGLLRLVTLEALGHKDLLGREMSKRKSDLGYIIHRLYCILKGTKEPRDWCSPGVVLPKMSPLCKIYGTPCEATTTAVKSLLYEALIDFCLVGNQQMSEKEAEEIIDLPDQYVNTLSTIVASTKFH